MQRNDAILAATAELLVEVGPDGVTTNLIAARAGIPIGSVYYLYPNKQAIYLDLIDGYLAQIAELTQVPSRLKSAAWQVRFDYAVDQLANIWWKQKAFPIVWRVLKNSPELEARNQAALEVAQQRNERFVSSLVGGMPKRRLRVVARTMARIIDRLLDLSIEPSTGADRRLIVEELKIVIKAYLSHHVEQGAAG